MAEIKIPFENIYRYLEEQGEEEFPQEPETALLFSQRICEECSANLICRQGRNFEAQDDHIILKALLAGINEGTDLFCAQNFFNPIRITTVTSTDLQEAIKRKHLHLRRN